MIRLVTLLKRRPGMTLDEFITHYEEHHRRIGEKVLGGYANHYSRRFIRPADGVDQEQDFDVIMEIGFPDQATYEACFAAMEAPEIRAEITEDEERLFDRSRIRGFHEVAYSESDMPPVG